MSYYQRLITIIAEVGLGGTRSARPFADRMSVISMQTIHIAICGVASILLAGCLPVPIPGKVDTSPEVYGRVIDAANEQPIPGATVMFKDLHGKQRSKTSTQANGTFHLGPEWHSYRVVIFTPCPVRYIPKRPPYAWFLEIANPGYVTREIDLRYDYPISNNTLRLGDVKLDPIWPTHNTNRANQTSEATR